MPLGRHNIVDFAQATLEREGVPVPRMAVLFTLNTLIDALIATLKNGDSVRLRGFGEFRVVTSKPRLGINPRNPTERVQIPARRQVKFRAGDALKALVNA